MRKLYMIGVFIFISMFAHAQINASNNDTVRVKLQKAEVQPRDVSEKNIQQEQNKKTNPEGVNTGNTEAVIKRKEN